MTRILHQLPIAERDSEVRVPEGWVSIRPYQIVMWVSLSLPKVHELDPVTPRFPVLLDTGLNHNFAIREDHLVRWAGLRPSSLLLAGTVEVAGRQIPLLGANAWIYPNRPGRMEILSQRPPIRLNLPRGIAVYPQGVPNPNRLPTLGLRALLVNNLKLIIDGERREVTLKTAGWFS
jgi:hypothetical protein